MKRNHAYIKELTEQIIDKTYPSHNNSHLHVEWLFHKEFIVARFVEKAWEPGLIPDLTASRMTKNVRKVKEVNDRNSINMHANPDTLWPVSSRHYNKIWCDAISNSSHYSSIQLCHGKCKYAKVLISIRMRERYGDRHSLFHQTD